MHSFGLAKLALWALIVAEGALAIWVARPWITSDSIQYLALAESVADGAYGTFNEDGFEPDALRPPGYPLLLWGTLHVLSMPVVAVIILQLFVCLASIFLTQRFLEVRGVSSLPFLGLVAIYPFPIMYSVHLMTEAWVMLALVLITFLLVSKKTKHQTYAIAGLVSGIAIYFRADLLFVPLLIAGVIFIRERQSGNRVQISITRALLPIAAAAGLLLPYSAWNFAHFGRLSPIPAAGALGNSLYLATWQAKLPQEDLTALYHGKTTELAQDAGLTDEVRGINAQLGAAPLTAPWNPAEYPNNKSQIQSARITREVAITRIFADPRSYIKHVVQNGWRLWNSSAYPASIPPFAKILLQVSSGAIWILGMSGVVLSLARLKSWPLPPITALILLYVPAVHLWLHTEARYTASVRPLLLMIAAAFIWWTWQHTRDRLRHIRHFSASDARGQQL